MRKDAIARGFLLCLLGGVNGFAVRPAARRPLVTVRNDAPQAQEVAEKNRGVVLALVTLWMGAHVVPLLIAQPADAVDSVAAVIAPLPEKALWKKVAFGGVMLLSVSHSLLPNLWETKSEIETKSAKSPNRARGGRPRMTASPKMSAGDVTAAALGAIAALAAIPVWPVSATTETALDTAKLLDVPAEAIPEASSLQWAALAVTLFSVLPVPGMLPGAGGGAKDDKGTR